jgi:hypothetical protein
MRILIIWDSVGDELSFHVVENMTERQLLVLDRANGKYINIDENKEVRMVNDALESDRREYSKKFDMYLDSENHGEFEDWVEEWGGIWSDCMVEAPLYTKVDRVYYCGISAKVKKDE